MKQILFSFITMRLELKETEKITSVQHDQARLHGNPQGAVGRALSSSRVALKQGDEHMTREG